MNIWLIAVSCLFSSLFHCGREDKPQYPPENKESSPLAEQGGSPQNHLAVLGDSMTVGILADSKLGEKDSLLKIIGENAANLENALGKNGKLTQKILDEIGNEKNAQPELTALLSSKEWSLPKALGVESKDIKSIAKNGSKFSDLKKNPPSRNR